MPDNRALKKAILDELSKLLMADRELMLRAAVEAREAATHSESVAEDKYDTRGLEASYLAGAQAERIRGIDKLLNMYKFFEPQDFSPASHIAAGALIELRSGAKGQLYFIVTSGAGRRVTVQGKEILVLTAQSPLGAALVGRKAGEHFEFGNGAKAVAYEITQVF